MILLIFKIWKFGNIRFVGNLIWHTYWNFFMTMTSLPWRHLYLERSQSVQFFAQQFSFATCKCWRTLWVRPTRKVKNKQTSRQTLMFHFSTYRPISCKHLSHHTPVWPHERIDRCVRCIGRRNNRFFLVNNTFSTMRKLFKPNMYCWSRKTLVTIYWTHLRLNGICAKSFCLQQTNNRRLFLMGWLHCNVAISNVYKWRHSDVVIKLIARTQN